MNENLVEMLKDFKSFIIKARFQDETELPKHIKDIYAQMNLSDGVRYFYFRMDARPGNKYISIYADPKYGKYPFAGPGMFEIKKDNMMETGAKIIERLEDTWWLPRNSFDNWFEVECSEQS